MPFIKYPFLTFFMLVGIAGFLLSPTTPKKVSCPATVYWATRRPLLIGRVGIDETRFTNFLVAQTAGNKLRLRPLLAVKAGRGAMPT